MSKGAEVKAGCGSGGELLTIEDKIFEIVGWLMESGDKIPEAYLDDVLGIVYHSKIEQERAEWERLQDELKWNRWRRDNFRIIEGGKSCE